MELKNQLLLKKVLKYSGIVIAAGILFALFFFMLVYVGVFGSIPGKTELSAISNAEASLVYSTDNVIIGEYFAQNRTNIRWNDLPKHLKNALIATEDKRFFTHKGYDLQSYFRVIFKKITFQGGSGGGGSTLTQQLAKNLFGRNNYSFFSMPVNKIREIIIA